MTNRAPDWLRQAVRDLEHAEDARRLGLLKERGVALPVHLTRTVRFESRGWSVNGLPSPGRQSLRSLVVGRAFSTDVSLSLQGSRNRLEGSTMARTFCVGLIATEMCSRGGVQSFMWRLTELFGCMVEEGKAEAFCLSLNDTTEALRHHPAIPSGVHAWGAGRSKVRLATHAVTRMPAADFLIVGHIGPAPLGPVLCALRRARRYAIVLYGIEAWREGSLLERCAARSAANLVAITDYTAKEFSRHNRIPIERFHVIHPCANEQVRNAQRHFRLNGGFKLLCVARQALSERCKGFEHIFEALARLGPEYPDVHLNVVGDGDDQPNLKQMVARLGLAPRVTFWGEVSDQQLDAAYADCDVFVLPSKKEGFGIVFLEAMRHSRPCIGGNHGGTPEVIEHGKSGFLVEYGDATAIARHIAQLKRDPALRASLGARGRELVETRFSSAQFRDAWCRLLFD